MERARQSLCARERARTVRSRTLGRGQWRVVVVAAPAVCVYRSESAMHGRVLSRRVQQRDSRCVARSGD